MSDRDTMAMRVVRMTAEEAEHFDANPNRAYPRDACRECGHHDAFHHTGPRTRDLYNLCEDAIPAIVGEWRTCQVYGCGCYTESASGPQNWNKPKDPWKVPFVFLLIVFTIANAIRVLFL